MCLLFVKPADAKLTEEQVADFHTRNSDGYGVMYAKDGMLHTNKELGSKKDWVKFFMDMQALDLDMAFHLRMKTHGHIDLTNCHPYPVFGFEGADTVMPVALMHNGVLRQGNSGDITKSDTWHYIRNYIRKLAKNDPAMIFTKEFAEVIGEHIGSTNKFAMMNHLGQVQVINRKAGVEWNGIWFSNTYAWSPRNDKLYPGADVATGVAFTSYTGFYGNSWKNDDVKPPKVPADNKISKVITKEDAQALLELTMDEIQPRRRTGRARKILSLERERKERQSQTNLISTNPAGSYSYTKYDVEYVADTLLEEKSLALVALQITVPQIETLLAAHGPNQVTVLVEAAVFNKITPIELAECFRDQRKAAQWFRERSHAVA